MHLIDRLADPDEDLQTIVERQLAVEPPVIDYIGVRMEWSLDAANRIVAELDREALIEGRSVTRFLAARLFGDEAVIEEEEDLV